MAAQDVEADAAAAVDVRVVDLRVEGYLQGAPFDEACYETVAGEADRLQPVDSLADAEKTIFLDNISYFRDCRRLTN